MKKVKFFLIPLALMFVGCTDFLTLEPQDELIREEYWKTEGDVVSVLGATYGKMAGLLDEFYYWSELRGGLISPEEKRVSTTSLEFFNYNINEYNDKIRWDDFYIVINLANTIIKYAPLAKENDQTFSTVAYNGYLAEAYFIRSLCYFYLVKAFRDVPFILEPYATDGQDFSIAKTDEQEIIDYLISDMKSVEEMAFSYDYFQTVEDKKGRVTINAVNALLADLYLWNDDYNNCIETCDLIGNVYLENGEDYFSIFSDEGNSLESILELQFDYDIYQTTNSLYRLTSNNSRGDREFIVSELLSGLYTGNDYRQYAPEGDVTINTSNASIWKYEGNEPWYEPRTVVDRTSETSDANWIFYRLPEIYLMKAEAYAELDNPTQALVYLNRVRDRAGIDQFRDTDKKEILEEVLNERAREFVGEGKRWFDLVRISRRDINNRLSFIYDAIISNVNPQSRTAAATKIKDYNSWFLPIYYNELLLNRQLEQNPFYE